MRIGVLIIGSLLWDDREHRVRWREECLDVEKKSEVTVPIRYGRASDSRDGTYTMVFSRLAERATYGVGTAVVVPCKAEARSLNDLLCEARRLWVAESTNGRPQASLAAGWGAVGAMFRHGYPDGHVVRQGWIQDVSGAGYPTLPHAVSEQPPMAANGLLTFPWPRGQDGVPLAQYDVLLATATKPTLTRGHYPTSAAVARAWLRSAAGHERYFFTNVVSGIRTYQDVRIWKLIRAARPQWLNKYAAAIAVLEGASSEA